MKKKLSSKDIDWIVLAIGTATILGLALHLVYPYPW